ncbi:hypothetical protein D9615_009009 [Tricholomella constricta]|uniref:Uncharacterized protein n=1 Tax=Tricholomella constricta TaxID=117010 RepID=A0A8H5LZ26_9AGAR|nr:hypothetical protein D9615_009009 [Tricholomella constricta]
MVKRAKSPDTAEDEKYFTVYQPYPLNANWELPDDYITFSRWIAAIIGTDPVHALHYKPSARGMVLIEVDKKYPHTARLLGEHKWTNFLNNPSKEETGKVSQIFHCLYNTGRAAQKDGWKRIHVEAHWFKDWSPTTDFKYPYPQTEWCPTPAEDKTNKSLCRPLPTKVKPPPPKAAPPVVGSANWINAKTGPSPNTPQALKGEWAKGRKAGPTLNTRTVPVVGSTPSPKSATAKSPSAWSRPILQSNSSGSRSNASPGTSPASANTPMNAWARPPYQKSAATPVTPSNDTPPFPPGLAIRVPLGQSLPVPPGLTKPQISNDTSTSGSGSSSEGSTTEKALDELFDEKVMISLSPSQDRQLYGLAADQSPELDSDVMHPWEANIQTFDSMQWNTADNRNGNGNWGGDAPVDLWGDKTGEAKKPAVALCPHHAHTCKKGVCSWRAKQVKEEERLAALAKKIDAGSKGSEGKAGAKKGGWRQNPSTTSNADDDEDGFSKVGGGRNKGRRMGPGRGRESRGGGDGSSAGGSYESRGWAGGSD